MHRKAYPEQFTLLMGIWGGGWDFGDAVFSSRYPGAEKSALSRRKTVFNGCGMVRLI